MKVTFGARVLAAALLPCADAFWRLPCGVIQTSRLDPIINPGTISGHVHKIVGPPTINPNSDYNSLINSRCTSCAVQADKSAYWTPLMYYQHKNGSFEEVQAGGTTVYYLGRGENSSNIVPFPKGFRMISGNPAVRAYDNSTYTFGGQNGVIYTGGRCRTGDNTCVGGKFVQRTGKNDPPGPVFTGRPVSDRVSYACLDAQSMPETNSITRTSCANGLRAQVHFPSCWDGKNLYLAGNKHVDYLSQIDNGICPPSFPVQLPLLFFEVLYSVSRIKQDGGQFVFSMGDPTGYGFHGDFLNGWDEDVLERAIDNCLLGNPSGEITSCSTFSPYIDQNAGFNCPEQPEYYDEDVRGMIGTSLPGCNKITPGPAPATSADLACPPGTKTPPQNSNSNFSSEAAPSNPKVGSVANGFAFAGCFKDDSSHSFSVVDTSSDDMTNAKCQAFCSGKGLPLAATEYSDECYCGYSLSTSNNPQANCSTMICAGNSSEYCGGPSLLSVYNSTTFKGSYNPTLPSPGQDAGGGFTYMGCASEGSNGRALGQASTTSSSNMTNDYCASFCASKGFPLFGTEYSSECYCGSSLATGSSLGQSGCSMLCSGSPPTSGPFAQWANTCGGSRRLTVWRNNKLGGSPSTAAASATPTASSRVTRSMLRRKAGKA